MSHPESRERGDLPPLIPPPVSAWDYWKFLLPIPLLLIGMFSLCIVSPACLEQLLLGWIYFPLRVFPNVTTDGPAALLGLVSLLAFAFGLFATLKWFSRHWKNSQTNSGEGSINFVRVAALGTFGVGLLFASGIAMVGMTHQLVWLGVGRANSAGARGTDAREVRGIIATAVDAARHNVHRNNLKQIGLGFHNFESTWKTLPPGGTINHRGELLHGWIAFLGVDLNYNSNNLDYSKPWNVSPNAEAYRCALPELINPAIPERFDENGFGYSHVAGNVHVLPIRRMTAEESQRGSRFGDHQSRSPESAPLKFDDIKDGLSHTILAGGVSTRLRPWGHPANVRDPALGLGQSPEGFAGASGTDSTFLIMCDGSVRPVSNNVDRKVIAAMGTPAGGEKIPADQE